MNTTVATGITARALHEYSKRGNPITPVVGAIVGAICLAVVVFVINIILAGFCVYYMFFASRYYRRQIKLFDSESASSESQSPIRLEDTPPPTARFPFNNSESSMSMKQRASSFLGLGQTKTTQSETSGSTLVPSETTPPPSVTSPTIPCSRKFLASVIIPTGKARMQPYTADPQPRHSFWGA